MSSKLGMEVLEEKRGKYSLGSRFSEAALESQLHGEHAHGANSRPCSLECPWVQLRCVVGVQRHPSTHTHTHTHPGAGASSLTPARHTDNISDIP